MNNTTNSYAGTGSATNPTTTTGTTTSPAAQSSNRGAGAAEGVKGIFAKGHGIGESIRGNINAALDGLTGDTATAQAKNDRVIQGGEREYSTGQFEKRGTTDKAL